MAGLDPAIPMRMVADWHCIFRKAEVGRGGWVKPSQHAVGESIISAFGISHRADALAAFAGCVPTVLWCCPGSISARRRHGWRTSTDLACELATHFTLPYVSIEVRRCALSTDGLARWGRWWGFRRCWCDERCISASHRPHLHGYKMLAHAHLVVEECAYDGIVVQIG
jgi:hypothetical protein